ncbi:MAG: addiction module toxin RelE [Gammaproteobacteria bacterium HGW-Gammaproteobacteria-10]|nr:MAG: addiction module toxin RelE [Gammaproteobacteria bacterium HGW-Gammaproteobacteria-10]
MKLLFADSAINDLMDIKAYYREQVVEQIGDQFVSEIIAHLEVLIEHPEIGRMVPEFAESDIRELIHPPFRVVYWLDNPQVHVVRVWRSERLLQLPNLNRT